jgi:hypothetical protein
MRPETGMRDLTPMVWGMPRSRNGRMVRQINARGETIGSGISRCAVISDGFYESPGLRRIVSPTSFIAPATL